MYLQHFDYYHQTRNNTHANEDDFDELLESAMRTYQLNYHLIATGTLDDETISKMMMPHCGVAKYFQWYKPNAIEQEETSSPS